MANLIKSYHLSTGEVQGELISQGRYSVQKLLTNTVTRYYKTVEYNNSTLPISQYLIKTVPSNVLSIYLYCTGYVRKYQLPKVSSDYQEYLTVYVADDRSTYYLFQMECYESEVYNTYTPPAVYTPYIQGEVTGAEEDELCQFVINHPSLSTTADDGEALTINDKYFFSSESARDDYFEDHPEELAVSPLYVMVGTELYKYNAIEEEWEEITAVIMGPKGEPGLASNISIGTVETVGVGESAYVRKSASSTEINSVFDFGIPRGPQGEKGDSAEIIAKGDYSASSTYNKNDTVIGSDRNTYICLVNGTHGINPVGSVTPNWGLLVSKGEKGDDGEPGPAGKDGATPEIDPTSKNWIIDGDDTGVHAEGVSNKWLFTENEIHKDTPTIISLSELDPNILVNDVLLSQHLSSYNVYGVVTELSSTEATITYKGCLDGLLAIIPDFNSSKDYSKDEIVTYDGIMYRAKYNISSGNFNPNDWMELKTKLITILDDFKSDYEYSFHELAYINNRIYRTIITNLQQSTFSLTDTIVYWTVIHEALEWQSDTDYNQEDSCYYNNSGILICNETHHSNSTFDSDESSKWDAQTDHPQWQANTSYSIGDTVEYNNKIYKCTNVPSQPQATFLASEIGPVWEELSIVGDYLPLSGGTVTGSIEIDDGNQTGSTELVKNGLEIISYNGFAYRIRTGHAGSSISELKLLGPDNKGLILSSSHNHEPYYTNGSNSIRLLNQNDKAAANGVASLDSNTKVPTTQLPVMVGADGSSVGTAGIVPQPAAADNTKFLKGDGTWGDVVQSNFIKNINIVTQSEYDAMKQAGTLVATTWYLIKEDESGESGL